MEFDYNTLVRIAIEKVVPLNHQLYIDSLVRIFNELFTQEVETALQSDNVLLAHEIILNNLKANHYKEVSKTPELDTDEFREYLSKSVKSFDTIFFNDQSISDEFKHSVTKMGQDRITDLRYIHGDHPNIDEADKYLKNKEGKFNHADKGRSLIDIIYHQIGLPPASFLFDQLLIQQVDQKLRPEFIDHSAPPLSGILHVDGWQNNVPCIDWKKSQSALLYLFLKLNNWSRDIPGGKLAQLLSLSFTVKGKPLSASNVSKALSKIHPKYSSPETQIIDLALNAANAGPD